MLLSSAIAAVGLAYVVAGVVGRRAQPRNRIGVLMVLVGVAWVLDYVVPRSAFFGLFVLSKVWPALLAHLVTAFPTGRLRTVPRRLVVGSAYGFTVALCAAIRSPFEGWASVLVDAETPLTVVLGVAILGLQLHRWRVSSLAQRRTLTSMLGASSVAVVVYAAWDPMARSGLEPPVVTLMLALAGVPAAYVAGLLRRRMDRGGVADLVVRLSGGGGRGVQEALAASLKDPGVRVGYWVAPQERYVDASGAVVEGGEGVVQTRVDVGGEPVALLLHDPGLDLELVDAACAAVGLALENERLTTELRARVRQLAESRGKLVLAADTERRRLERDLHDGVQQRLLSVAMTLGLAEVNGARELVGEAKAAVLATIEDVRAVCHGVYPPLLAERGLHGAVRELTALVSFRVDLLYEVGFALPAVVETTAYYVVAEALANVSKHAEASVVRVEITSRGGELAVRVDDDGRGGAGVGSGLRGLAERVEAVGGTMKVVSPVGEGTSVRVVLPCGS
ncbi:histidine kinase [Saccharothrix sp.]|uniref:histidine kinase n=1 Tax=Saccharothrix sp. TaxID=1873460 RepID=UPI0028119074|nr:histidine kinase [Saccharothrix sp.]